jgi:pyruvate kinase
MSAKNLIHYLAVRQVDIRDLQIELGYLGLSSLGRLEAHVMAGLKSVAYALNCMSENPIKMGDEFYQYVHFKEGDDQLRDHTEALFGPRPFNRNVRIMVTLPRDAGTDLNLITTLIESGMNVARINAAHDEEQIWNGMVSNVRIASKKLNQSCKILFDLEGPKLRTGRIAEANEQPSGKHPFIKVNIGDVLRITMPDTPGQNAQFDDSGSLMKPARIPCTLPELFDQVKSGEKIFFDDGMIEGIVEEVQEHQLTLRVTRCKKKGAKLRADKGINLPDTVLNIPALSSKDLDNLDFAAKNADMIGLSFVKDPRDVEQLQVELAKRTSREVGIVLKIETKTAFENLSRLLLVGLRKPPLGVMVARGDLGVEIGFERMSEVQEQILWLCEAAHVPVIWATQVLEQMNKTGLPTRGEVTDAAMSSRAECVMLNKGPFIVETVRFLNNILMRMMDHNNKKTPMLRKLKISEGRWPGRRLEQ